MPEKPHPHKHSDTSPYGSSQEKRLLRNTPLLLHSLLLVSTHQDEAQKTCRTQIYQYQDCHF